MAAAAAASEVSSAMAEARKEDHKSDTMLNYKNELNMQVVFILSGAAYIREYTLREGERIQRTHTHAKQQPILYPRSR